MAVSLSADIAADAYCQMYESLCEEQQAEELAGRPLHARRAGRYAFYARRALEAELTDPHPKNDPYKAHCPDCTEYIARARPATRGDE